MPNGEDGYLIPQNQAIYIYIGLNSAQMGENQ